MTFDQAVEAISTVGLPGLAMAGIIFYFYKLYPTIEEGVRCWFEARSNAYEVRAEADKARAEELARSNELTRNFKDVAENSTAAVKCCDTTMQSVAKVLESMERTFNSHESLSSERDLRTEKQIDDVTKRVGNIQGSCEAMKVLLTNGGR